LISGSQNILSEVDIRKLGGVIYVALLKWSKDIFENLEIFGGAEEILGGVRRNLPVSHMNCLL